MGFDWEKDEQVWEKVQEEMEEFKAEADADSDKVEEEFGDLLFSLINFVITIVIGGIEIAVLGSEQALIANLYSLAVLLPALGVSVRRLHDTGRTGWWILIGLIPLIGLIVLLVFFFQEGDPGENEYGPNPKAEPAPA